MLIDDGANDTNVQGNYIGTDVTGTADLGNAGPGIRIDQPAANTVIGGTIPVARNVISGNDGQGIFLVGLNVNGTQILGNFIGTNAAGTGVIGNSRQGVAVFAGTAASNNIVGGTTATTPGASCTGACNLISGNGADGVDHGAGSALTIQGNYVGTDVSGTVDLGNAGIGINIRSDASGDLIGGVSPSARNVISGNNSRGVDLGGGSISGIGANTLLGNYIGTNAAGTAALSNSLGGVLLSSSNNTLGGASVGAGNLISGHAGQIGVQINGGANNKVQGNFIGTDASGTIALGNETGIVITLNSTSSLIGGTTPGARNLISGNTIEGILIGRPSTANCCTSSNNTVIGNFIGTDVNGFADLGNGGDGVVIRDSDNNTIGGSITGERNVIAGNNGSGVRLDKASSGSSANAVRGNYIGTAIDGTTALGNSASGVFVADSSNNTIGGSNPADGNLIAFNGGDGVFVVSGTGNSIRANSVFNNNELGIDLNPDSVTPNDPNDTDTGPNNLQNFPVLTDVTVGGGNANIAGTLDTALANTAFTIEFFANDSCNAAAPNDFGEGQTLIHSTTVTTDASGDANFNRTFVSSLSAGKFITATATDPAGNTSEFSQCRQAEEVTLSISDVTVTEGNSGQTSASFTVSLSRTRGVDVFVNYSTADGSAHSGSDYVSASGTLAFAPGETSKPVTVQVIGDTVPESAESFFVNLTGASGATLVDPQGQAVIVNDDSPTAAPALISGQITTANGVPVGGVVMTLTGGQELRRAITDAQGRYVFADVDTDGFYTVSPERANYLFSPAQRSFSLLTNKTDAVFSASSIAESGNPLDTPEFFVRQNYLDFLGREPEQGGLDYWSAQIRACGDDQTCIHRKRIGVSAAFYIEQEFQRTGNFVHRLYVASLGRGPDFSEFNVERRKLTFDATPEQQLAFAEDWVSRESFRQLYPSDMSAAKFVNQLFDTAELKPYIAERQQQIEAMVAGKTRAQVLRDVVEMPDIKDREFNASFVLLEYFGYLQREPEGEGYEYWLNVLNNREPNNYRAMVCAFITSAEYQQRFSSVVTHTNADCAR